MKTFIVAAKYENFRKTSEELFLTQPAITKHIKNLEEHLHIQLFDRIGKKISLTSAGLHFLPHAKEIIKKYEQGVDDLESWKQGYKRKLTIASAPQIASSVLPSILRSFINENPDIEFLINVLKSYEIGEEISTGRADLGLTRIKPNQTNINYQLVHEEPVILVGPNLGDDKKYNESLALQDFRLITHNHPYYWDELLNQIKHHFPSVRTMKVNQIEITKRFIENGLGISYLPYTMVQDEIQKNSLVEIKSELICLPTSQTYVLTKTITNDTKKFIDFFQSELES